jgi:hypothetical protein
MESKDKVQWRSYLLPPPGIIDKMFMWHTTSKVMLLRETLLSTGAFGLVLGKYQLLIIPAGIGIITFRNVSYQPLTGMGLKIYLHTSLLLV